VSGSESVSETELFSDSDPAKTYGLFRFRIRIHNTVRNHLKWEPVLLRKKNLLKITGIKIADQENSSYYGPRPLTMALSNKFFRVTAPLNEYNRRAAT
jgi:hypothetical protein